MNLQEFVRLIEEGRPRKDDVNVDPKVAKILDKGEHVVMDGDGEFHGEKVQRVDNSPVNNVVIPKDQRNKNMKRLLAKFRSGEDFLVIGRAGWGKTSIIKNLSKKFGYVNLPTIILATADPTDLGGRPVNDKDEKSGRWKQQTTLPPWAQEIFDNPQKKYLVFFDEINQAPYEVMNTLMEIILDHKVADVTMSNFFVGAAGNEKDENIALQQIEKNKPLMSRLLPVIHWEVNTPAAWHNAFVYLHEEYDKKLSKDFVNMIEKCSNIDIFDNPRNIEKYIFSWTYAIKKRGAEWYEDFEIEDYYDRLMGVIAYSEKELSKSEDEEVKEMAEQWYNFMNDVDDEEDDDNRGKDVEMVDPFLSEVIKRGIERGFIGQPEGEKGKEKEIRYGISRENIIAAIAQGGELNPEQIKRLIKKFEADGSKFKYEKDSEWKKAGLKDPFED